MNWNQIASSLPAELGTDDEGDTGQGVPPFPSEAWTLPGDALLGLPFMDPNTWESVAGIVSNSIEVARTGVAWDSFPGQKVPPRKGKAMVEV